MIAGNLVAGWVSDLMPTLEKQMRIRRSSARPEGPGDLNLVPIMNLIVCLVPIVLLGMSVVKTGVIETQAPRFVNARCTDGCDGGRPLNLAVHLSAEGIRLSLGGADGSEAFARDDLPGLYRRLVGLKESHPDETVVNVSADDRVPYRDVVALIDVMRHELDGEVRDRADLARLIPRYTERGAAPLFPDVMFAVAH